MASMDLSGLLQSYVQQYGPEALMQQLQAVLQPLPPSAGIPSQDPPMFDQIEGVRGQPGQGGVPRRPPRPGMVGAQPPPPLPMTPRRGYAGSGVRPQDLDPGQGQALYDAFFNMARLNGPQAGARVAPPRGRPRPGQAAPPATTPPPARISPPRGRPRPGMALAPPAAPTSIPKGPSRLPFTDPFKSVPKIGNIPAMTAPDPFKIPGGAF